MNYHYLGRTDLRVSEISLGTVEIGMAYGLGSTARPDDAEAARILHCALDMGINLLDTARAYGESEAIIGRVLQSRRSEYILTSKVQTVPRDQVAQSVHESLRHLRTEVIDIMMIHSASVEVIRNGEMASVLADLKAAGHIRFTGASVYGNEAADAAVESGSFDCIQIGYSVLDRRPERGLAELAKEAGVGIVARSVLLKGSLTDRRSLLPDSLGHLRRAVERMQKLAEKEGCSLPELAYRYVLGTGAVQTALVGAGSADEVAHAVHFANAGRLPELVMQHIRSEPELEEFYLNPGNWPAF